MGQSCSSRWVVFAEQGRIAILVEMTDLEKSILATVVYYDGLDFPMTVREVGRFLINPVRFGKAETAKQFQKSEPIGFESVEEALPILKRGGWLEEMLGFYFLPGRRALYQERMERIKLAEEKWKKARRYLFWIQMVPYVEAALASGSLALGHTSEESDLDVLIVTKAGRIWSTRLLIFVLFGLMGVRRRKEQVVAPDKICPNHYITSRSLRIPLASLYNAQTYAHLIPVYVRGDRILEDFWRENSWVGDYLQNWERPDSYQGREVKPSLFLKTVGVVAEAILDFTLGHFLEKIARKIQRRRIKTDLPGRIALSDQQLEFHPYSVEGKILEKYNEKMAAWDLFGNYREQDSGLK